ncbi:MAG: transglutaminase-like cysteine peptidase [Ferrimonas sp.]
MFLLLIASHSPLIANEALWQQVHHHYGAAAQKRLAQWQQALEQLKTADPHTQIARVNAMANHFLNVTDEQMWGQIDYWASTAEFVGAGGGDCEDFAMAKFTALHQLGMSSQQLRLVYVKAEQQQQYHIVLAYYAQPNQAIPLILDNLTPHIYPADKRPDLTPIFSFNATDIWLNIKRQLPQKVGSSHRFQRWQQQLHRGQAKHPKLQLPFHPFSDQGSH